jgi:hypothetical protein
MNEPPDQTALLSAAYLLSLIGTHLPKYSLKSSGYFFKPVSVSVKITPCSSSSFKLLWYTTSLSN